jgi:adenylate kinase
MEKKSPFTAIFIGISGSGKGTHSKILMDELVSTNNLVTKFVAGDELRKMAGEPTTLGNTVRRSISKGGLAPDSIVNLAADSFLRGIKESEYCFFDGYPRTKDQAVYLDSSLHKNRRKDPVIVIYMKLEKEVAMSRLKERALIENRTDDINPEAINERFAWFKEHVEPTIDFYRTASNYSFIEVDVAGTEEETFAALKEQVSRYL